MKSSFENRCRPYLGQEPYLHLCFSDADAALVQPLMLRLHDRGVRLWYSMGKTANSEVLARRNERADHAALTVLYLSEAARKDTDVKDVILYCQEQGLPLVCIDTDEGDHELSIGLTGKVPHVPAWQMTSVDELEAALVRTDGFVQELVGPRPEPYVDPLRKVALALGVTTLAVLLAGVAAAWHVGLIAPSSRHPGDTDALANPELLAAARLAQGGGAVTDESLSRITVLRLNEVPAADDLAPFVALKRIELPQELAPEAVALLDEPFDVVLAEGV